MSDSDDIDEADIPDRFTCQRLTEQFATLTGTDTACAQFYLQDRKWDLQRSVNAYFDAKNSGDGVNVLTDGDEPEVIISFESLAAAVAAATGQSQQPTKLKLISWNIDGLDDNDRRRRTKSVCNTINCELPDVVFLQEVVPETLAYLTEHLPAYKTVCGNNQEYFTATFIRINSVEYQQHDVIEFPTSLMMRNMLVVKAKIGSVPLTLVNSHLESTGEHTDERIRQLQNAFKYMLDVKDEQTVLFGGDLNLRDKELARVGGIPAGVEDLWVTCGSRPECSYTWDMTRNDNLQFHSRFKPRFRFDRVYIRHSSPGRLTPVHFGFVGLERLKSCRRFPSDHWGIITHFELNSAP